MKRAPLPAPGHRGSGRRSPLPLPPSLSSSGPSSGRCGRVAIGPVAPDRTVAVQTPASVSALCHGARQAGGQVERCGPDLAWRGSSRRSHRGSQARIGRVPARRFGSARRALAALTEKYAASVEVFFYLGVSQLFLDDARSALDSFATAATRADAMFAPDITWYRSIAEERLGRIDAARTGLTELCGGTTPRAADACAALGALK